MSKIVFYIIFFISFISIKESVSAQTLHAILVADDIHDISHVTTPDIHIWQKELRDIVSHTNLTLNEKIFCGREFVGEAVKNYIEDLVLDESDLVIFYFSGHGYRTTQKKTPWPFLNFDVHQPGLDIQWIAHTLYRKKPQFILVMTDCCNNYIEQEGKFEPIGIDVNLTRINLNNPKYEQLFTEAKGCVVISSCSAGQFSYGSHEGGLYTQCFFNSLNHELGAKNPNWKDMLNRIEGYIHRVQQPVTKIYP